MDKINRTYLSKPLAENNIWSYRVIPPTHSASQRYKCKILYLIISQRSKADFLFRFKPAPSKKPDQHSISYVHKANFLYSFIPPPSKKPISTAYHSFLKPIFCIALNRPPAIIAYLKPIFCIALNRPPPKNPSAQHIRTF